MGKVIQMGLGSKIKALRKRREWTQGDLASASGLSVPLLSLIESGQREGSRETILSLAEAFSVSPGLLLDPNVGDDQVAEMSQILEGMSQLGPADLEAVRAMIKALRSSR